MIYVTDYMVAMRRLAAARAAGNRLEMCEAFWDLDDVALCGDTEALRAKARKEMAALGGYAFVADYRCHLLASITDRLTRAEREGRPLKPILGELELLADVGVIFDEDEPENPMLTGVATIAAATLRRYAA